MNEKRNKTMSVMTMGKLLGLKKTESFWLVHKGFFDTILVNGKTRIVTESFEKWYANQVKYHKVTGEPPGEQLKKKSYAARDISEILQISEARAYEVMKKAGVIPVIVDYQQRYPRAAFEKWYAGQSRYRNAEDRARDREIEKNSISMPDMARILDVPRSCVYNILRGPAGHEMLKVVKVADRKRIMLDSFEEWYCSQTEYLKPEDRPIGIPRKRKSYAESLSRKNGKRTRIVHYSENPEYLTVDEAALLGKADVMTVLKWIKAKRFPVIRVSRKVIRIPAESYREFLSSRQKKEGE